MKTKFWSDFKNILFIDTGEASDFYKRVKNNNYSKQSFVQNIVNGKIKIATINKFRDRYTNGQESILPIIDLLKEQDKVKNHISLKGTNFKNLDPKFELLKQEYQGSKLNDHWLLLKILISNPKNKIYILTSDLEFINFIKKTKKIYSQVGKKIFFLFISHNDRNSKSTWYYKSINL